MPWCTLCTVHPFKSLCFSQKVWNAWREVRFEWHVQLFTPASQSKLPGMKFALSDTCSSLRLLRSLNCLAWSSLWVTRAALYACFAGHTFDFWFDCGLKIRYILWHSSRKCTDNLFIKRVITVSLKWAMFNKCAISATIIFPACLILEKNTPWWF